ncbi:MAG TPA: hypothetical protein VJI33_00710 [Candidatus Paceibacterota bacterium]
MKTKIFDWTMLVLLVLFGMVGLIWSNIQWNIAAIMVMATVGTIGLKAFMTIGAALHSGPYGSVGDDRVFKSGLRMVNWYLAVAFSIALLIKALF